MQLDLVLAGVTNLGLDTPPFIYLIERHPKYLGLVREVFQQIVSGERQGYSSVLTLVEVLTRPKRFGQTMIERQYNNILLNSARITLVNVEPVIADSAADLRARHNLRTPDAIQIATALAAGCEASLTNDRELRRVTALRVPVLDELTLERE